MPAKNLIHLALLIADESHAATYQSLGQYRQALLKEIAQASAAPEQEPVAFRHKLSIHKDWKYTDHRAPDSFELRECQIENLYTHADPAEVERLRAELQTERLRADAAVGDANDAEQQLAEAQALLRDAATAIDHLLNNIKATGKRLDLGLAPECARDVRARVKAATTQPADIEQAGD